MHYAGRSGFLNMQDEAVVQHMPAYENVHAHLNRAPGRGRGEENPLILVELVAAIVPDDGGQLYMTLLLLLPPRSILRSYQMGEGGWEEATVSTCAAIGGGQTW